MSYKGWNGREASFKAMASFGWLENSIRHTSESDGAALVRYSFPGLTFEVSISPDGEISARAHGNGETISADSIYPPEN